jgi:Ras-related protein Rab-6A
MSHLHYNVTPRVKYKLVFVGDSSVGKTSIISRYMWDHFDSNYDSTIGMDFLAKTHTYQNKPVRMQLWDTAGQERFRSLIPSYIRDSSVAVVVYSVDDRESFIAADRWIEEVRNERENDVLIVLVGNKIDLSSKEVTSRDGARKAYDNKALFIETSAKTAENVHELFDQIARHLPDKDSTSASAGTGVIKMNQQIRPVQAGCCKV